ncbi:hypothetical protein C8Q76DRAFT_739512 [Earliella scabrosa]|nr:hypothetical protein C8Q76DRAFT_739512 [Earliella scabrosa]
MLYGLNMHQCFWYFGRYPTDKRWLKGLVWAVVLLETFHAVLSCYVCYYYLVASHFNPIALLYGHWSIKLLPLCTGCIVVVCQR